MCARACLQIMEIASFEKFLVDKIKVGGKTGEAGRGALAVLLVPLRSLLPLLLSRSLLPCPLLGATRLRTAPLGSSLGASLWQARARRAALLAWSGASTCRGCWQTLTS